MSDYLKKLCHYGLTEEEKTEMEELQNELKKYKEMDFASDFTQRKTGWQYFVPFL